MLKSNGIEVYPMDSLDRPTLGRGIPFAIEASGVNPKLPLDPSVEAFYLDLFQKPCLL